MSVSILAVLALLTVVSVGAELYCKEPVAPNYGYIVSTGQKHNYNVGDIIIFKCNRGYEMVGSSNGHWSSQPPVCVDEHYYYDNED